LKEKNSDSHPRKKGWSHLRFHGKKIPAVSGVEKDRKREYAYPSSPARKGKSHSVSAHFLGRGELIEHKESNALLLY